MERLKSSESTSVTTRFDWRGEWELMRIQLMPIQTADMHEPRVRLEIHEQYIITLRAASPRLRALVGGDADGTSGGRCERSEGRDVLFIVGMRSVGVRPPTLMSYSQTDAAKCGFVGSNKRFMTFSMCDDTFLNLA
jgi:hypothetical protein